jgi:bifunctional oligoribonuclease and PAP phosphatase NrnA
MAIDWRPLIKIVSEAQTFVLTSHMRPDCDAIGSEMGLAHALRSRGKSVRIINCDPVPPHISFIDPNNEVEVLGRDVTATDFAPDVHIVLDTSAWAQLGPMAEVLRNTAAQRVVIDHHVSEDDLGAMMFKNPTAESTGRLVLEAINALGITLTPDMATPLFAALATDTGWFRFASVTEESFVAATQLVRAGARPRLHGRILTKVKSDLAGRLLWTAVTQDDLRAVGAEPTDTEDVINRLLGVAGVEVSLLMMELNPHETKVSFRSRSPVDVHKIAELFGGGGHRAAAGVRYPGPLREAEPAVLNAVRAAMELAP